MSAIVFEQSSGKPIIFSGHTMKVTDEVAERAEEAADRAEDAAEAIAGVTAYGAGQGGDDTAAFSAAALAAIALDTMGPPNNTSTVPRAPTGAVYVPAGTYTLTDVVDTGGKDITWILAPGAKINGSDFINGRTTRAGLKNTLGYSYGILDANGAFVATLGGQYSDKPAPVTGVANVAALADYSQIDGVALAGAAYSRPPLLSLVFGQVSYTSTTLTIIPAVTSAVRKRFRAGQVIVTQHPTPYLGVIQSWATVGGNTIITLGGGWYLRGSGGLGVQTPANTHGCGIQSLAG